MSYMTEWLAWKAGKRSDGEIIARMHVDPFFKRWFEDRRKALKSDSPHEREDDRHTRSGLMH